MIANTELSVQIAITKEYICSDQAYLRVRRPIRVDDGHGGYRDLVPEDNLPGLRLCRLIPQTSDTSTEADESRTTDGERRDPRYVLLCLPGEDFETGDIVSHNGIEWRLKQRQLCPEYEKKFDMVKYVGR